MHTYIYAHTHAHLQLQCVSFEIRHQNRPFKRDKRDPRKEKIKTLQASMPSAYMIHIYTRHMYRQKEMIKRHTKPPCHQRGAHAKVVQSHPYLQCHHRRQECGLAGRFSTCCVSSPTAQTLSKHQCFCKKNISASAKNIHVDVYCVCVCV
jgi:hypothetical protein